MENPVKNKLLRTFQGVVISDAMKKTIVVRVDRVKMNNKYHKQYTVSRRYHVHDENGSHHVGEKVSFVECRPLSKTKRWRAIGAVSRKP